MGNSVLNQTDSDTNQSPTSSTSRKGINKRPQVFPQSFSSPALSTLTSMEGLESFNFLLQQQQQQQLKQQQQRQQQQQQLFQQGGEFNRTESKRVNGDNSMGTETDYTMGLTPSLPSSSMSSFSSLNPNTSQFGLFASTADNLSSSGPLDFGNNNTTKWNNPDLILSLEAAIKSN